MKLNKCRSSRVFISSLAVFLSIGISVANAQIALDPPINFDGGDGMLQVVTSDINNDGLPDLITNGKKTDTVNVQINLGGGLFANVVEYPVGQFVTLPADLPAAEPLSIAVGDFNGDGNADIVSANSQAETVSILLNLGNGTFSSSVEYSVRPDGFTPTIPGLATYEPSDVKVADVNNDGIADLVTADVRRFGVSLLIGQGSLGIGNGAFAPAVYYPTGGQPSSIALDDVNGDNLVDLVVADKSPRIVPLLPGSIISTQEYHVSVLLNIGNGAFGTQKEYLVGINPLHIIIAKIDNDLCPDIVSANHSSRHTISILYNNCDGTGSFADQEQLPSVYAINAISAADLDGDGDLDLALAGHFTPGSLVLIENNTDLITGTTSFYPATLHGLGGVFNSPTYVLTVDADNDTDVDVLLLSKFSDNFSLLLNQKVANVPAVPPVVVGPPDLTPAFTKVGARFKGGLTQINIEFTVSNIGIGTSHGIIVADLTFSGDLATYRVYVSTAGINAGVSMKAKFKKDLVGDYTGRSVLVNVLAGMDNSDPTAPLFEENLSNNQDGALLP